VIVTEAFAATGLVVTLNVAELALAGTVTLAGTLAAPVLLLESVTTDPADGAGPVNVTVPVDEVPPVTEVGTKLTALSVGAATVNVADLETPKTAPIVTEVLAVTGVVVIVKVTEVAPAGTLTLDGTCATLVLLLESGTTAPPEGAGPVNFTVPVEEVAPVTVTGLTVMPLPLPLKVGAVTVKLPALLTP
jgi:hypothetical protein